MHILDYTYKELYYRLDQFYIRDYLKYLQKFEETWIIYQYLISRLITILFLARDNSYTKQLIHSATGQLYLSRVGDFVSALTLAHLRS